MKERDLVDTLTRLQNRRAFALALDNALASYSDGAGLVALILADVNGLKRINDAFGFFAGDEVLRSVGELLRGLDRTEAVAYRFGGDEFIVLCSSTTASQAQRLALRIETEAPPIIVKREGHEIGPLTISTGLACYPRDGRHAEDLLRAAYEALFRKKRGDNDEPPAPTAVPK